MMFPMKKIIGYLLFSVWFFAIYKIMDWHLREGTGFLIGLALFFTCMISGWAFLIFREHLKN